MAYPKRISIKQKIAKIIYRHNSKKQDNIQHLAGDIVKVIQNSYRRRKRGIASVMVVCLLLLGQTPIWASDALVKERIVNAVIGEAEGEPYRGKLAVACAIINRVHTHGSFDKAMRGVYGERSKRVINRLYSEKVRIEAEEAYEEALGVGTCDFIDNADHWEGTKFQTPDWAKDMVVTAEIGNQRFYRRK